MPYSKAPSGSFAVEHSPSLTYNNLTTNGTDVVFVHKEDVYAFKESGLGESKVTEGPFTTRLPYNDSYPIADVKWANVGGTDYLVLCTTQGFQVMDSAMRRLVFLHLLGGKPAGDESSGFCRGVASVPGTSTLLVGSSDGGILAFTAGGDSFELKQTLKGHEAPVCCIAADDRYVASGDEDGRIVLWDDALTRVAEFSEAGDPCTSIGMRGDLVVAGFATGHIRLYKISTQKKFCEIGAHARCVTAMDVHPSRPAFCSVGEDAVMNIWSFPDGESKGDNEVVLEMCAPLGDHLLTGVQFSRSGAERVMTATYDTHSIKYWKRD